MGGLTSPEFNAHTEEAWGKLNADFDRIVKEGIVDEILAEKKEAVDTWKEIESLSKQVTTGNDKFRDYLRVSCEYGRIKYEIIEQAWIVMLKGLKGDKTGEYDVDAILKAYKNYKKLWADFKALKENNEQCATLYVPYGFSNLYKDLHSDEGMEKAVNKYAGIAMKLKKKKH
jgi:hypothetical protein